MDLLWQVVLVVGVNHVATENAHYSNLAVYDASRSLGVTLRPMPRPSVSDAAYINLPVQAPKETYTRPNNRAIAQTKLKT